MYENQEEHAGAATPPHEPYGHAEQRSSQKVMERKSPLVAVLLSCFPGLGQIYIGYYQRGFVYGIITVSTIFLLTLWELQEFRPLLGPFLAFFWIYNLIDAARCANAVNRGAEAGIQPALPELPTAMGGGSAFAGGVLVVIGVLILGRTVLGFSLGWLAEWWPLLLIIFGIRLIMTGRRHSGTG